MARRRADRRLNLAVARVIPVFLVGVIGYVSYDLTKPLCVDYLIRPLPKYHRHPRVGTGAAVIVLYYAFLFPVAVTYLRLLHKVLWNPDFLPQRKPPEPNEQEFQIFQPKHQNRRRKRDKGEGPRSAEKVQPNEPDVERHGELYSGGQAFPLDSIGLESFYTKDVFVCQEDGRPSYCSKCAQFKTDRAHHCREVDRCVRKMDHFCPWVGGVVSESSFKFFIQFVVYAAILCIYTLVVFAVFMAELVRETGFIDPQWAVAIGLSGLFAIFTCGMTLSSFQLAVNNLSTIENLNRHSVIWTLAVRVPERIVTQSQSDPQWAPIYRTITYPLPSPDSPTAAAPQTVQDGRQPKPEERRHVFAILQTQPGENPFDLGSWLKNIQQVMGHSLLEWLLPFKSSPCIDHTSMESAFALGPVVSRLKREAGLESEPELEGSNNRQRQGGPEPEPEPRPRRSRKHRKKHRSTN